MNAFIASKHSFHWLFSLTHTIFRCLTLTSMVWRTLLSISFACLLASYISNSLACLVVRLFVRFASLEPRICNSILTKEQPKNVPKIPTTHIYTPATTATTTTKTFTDVRLFAFRSRSRPNESQFAANSFSRSLPLPLTHFCPMWASCKRAFSMPLFCRHSWCLPS